MFRAIILSLLTVAIGAQAWESVVIESGRVMALKVIPRTDMITKEGWVSVTLQASVEVNWTKEKGYIQTFQKTAHDYTLLSQGHFNPNDSHHNKLMKENQGGLELAVKDGNLYGSYVGAGWCSGYNREINGNIGAARLGSVDNQGNVTLDPKISLGYYWNVHNFLYNKNNWITWGIMRGIFQQGTRDSYSDYINIAGVTWGRQNQDNCEADEIRYQTTSGELLKRSVPKGFPDLTPEARAARNL